MEKKLPIGAITLSYDPIFDNTQLLVRSDINKFGYAIYEKFIDVISFDSVFIDKNITFDGINYGQIECMENFKLTPLETENKVNNDLSDFIINCLNNDTYVCCILNTYYIYNYANYEKCDMQHEMLIYGYNLVNSVFYATDFFDYQTRSYQEVLFKDINQSFQMSRNAFRNDRLSFVNQMTLLRLNQYKSRSINLQLIVDGLKRFLSKETYLFLPGTVLGASFFSVLKRRLKNNELNVKHFHFIYVHIAYMKERVDYININLHIRNDKLYYILKEVLKKSISLRNLAIKLNLTKQLEKVHSCEILLAEIEREYLSVINAYISYFENYIM